MTTPEATYTFNGDSFDGLRTTRSLLRSTDGAVAATHFKGDLEGPERGSTGERGMPMLLTVGAAGGAYLGLTEQSIDHLIQNPSPILDLEIKLL